MSIIQKIETHSRFANFLLRGLERFGLITIKNGKELKDDIILPFSWPCEIFHATNKYRWELAEEEAKKLEIGTWYEVNHLNGQPLQERFVGKLLKIHEKPFGKYELTFLTKYGRERTIENIFTLWLFRVGDPLS